MPITVGGYPHTSIKNPMSGEIVYRPNSNDPARTPLLPHNGANTTKEFVRPNDLIHLVKTLVICPTPILINCFRCTRAVLAFSFIRGNVGSEPGKEIGHGISGHAG